VKVLHCYTSTSGAASHIALIFYMHNGLRINETKNGKTTFLALSRLAYLIFNHPIVGKTKPLRQKWQQIQCYLRIANKLAKTLISAEKYRSMQENFDLTINYYWSRSWHLWTYHKLYKKQKKFDCIDFWLPGCPK